MGKIILPDKHIMLTSRSEVHELCKPLFDGTPLGYFDYGEFYLDGKIVELCTNAEWNKHLFSVSHSYPTAKEFEYNPHRYVVLSQQVEPPPAYQATPTTKRKYVDQIYGAAQFDVVDRFYIVQRHDTFYQICGFGPAKEKTETNIIEFYINNIPLLEKFRLHFIERAQPLINNARRTALYFEPAILNSNHSVNDAYYKEGLSLTPSNPPGFIIPEIAAKLGITKREFECLYYLARNYSAKEIGTTLKISKRTAERHISNMKLKLNCHRKSQLVDMFLNKVRNF